MGFLVLELQRTTQRRNLCWNQEAIMHRIAPILMLLFEPNTHRSDRLDSSHERAGFQLLMDVTRNS